MNQSIPAPQLMCTLHIKQRYYFIWEELKKISEMSTTNILYML